MPLSSQAIHDFEDILTSSHPSIPSQDVPQFAQYVFDLYALFLF